MSEYLFPTASNLAVFIDGIHVDLAYRVDIKDSAPKVPLYGYNDTRFSAVMSGRGIVQGFLAVNFIYPGYMTALMERRNKGKIGASARTLEFQEQSVKQFIFNELPANTDDTSRAARAEYIANLISPHTLQNTSSQSDVEVALVGVTPGARQSAFERKLVGSSKRLAKEAVKEALVGVFVRGEPLQERVRTSGRNPLEIDSELDMEVYYSNPDSSTWYEKLESVHFTDINKGMTAAGAEGSSEAILEVFEFFARSRRVVHVR